MPTGGRRSLTCAPRCRSEGRYRENRPAVPACLRLAEAFQDQVVDLPELVFAVRIGTGVIGAGFALPRDAGRRPALHAGQPSAVLPACPRAVPAPTLLERGVIGAGFALARDAGRRPALHPGQPHAVLSALAERGVIGAGFALPRDAGRRPPPGELASAPRRPRAFSRLAMRGFAALRAAVPV